MKIIIAGAGKVGTVLADQLIKSNHDVTVIDNNPDSLSYINNNYDVMCIGGDAVSPVTLKEAGVKDADVLLAVTASDEINLMSCLIAKKLGIGSTIARVRNPVYHESLNLIRSELGLSMAINPDLETAIDIFRSLRFKSAGKVETFVKSHVDVLTCVVKPKTPICDIQIKDLQNVIKVRILIFAIKREGNVFIPNGLSEIKAGDTLSFVAMQNDALEFFRKMGYDTGRIKTISILGGSRLGFYLAKMAHQAGISVKMVEKDRKRCVDLNENLPGAEIICGDATDTDLLDEEGILRSAAVATVTNFDETNTLISMFISKNAPQAKVITKIKKTDFEEMLRNLDVGSVYQPKYIAADRIIRYVHAMEKSVSDEMLSRYHVIDNQVVVMEFIISADTPNIGVPFKELKLKKGILIANITRHGKHIIPSGSDVFESGDTVLIASTDDGIEDIEDIFM